MGGIRKGGPANRVWAIRRGWWQNCAPWRSMRGCTALSSHCPLFKRDICCTSQIWSIKLKLVTNFRDKFWLDRQLMSYYLIQWTPDWLYPTKDRSGIKNWPVTNGIQHIKIKFTWAASHSDIYCCGMSREQKHHYYCVTVQCTFYSDELNRISASIAFLYSIISENSDWPILWRWSMFPQKLSHD